MLRSLFTAGSLTAVACSLWTSTALAGETGQGPMPYAPPPTVTVKPAYAPPPTYSPPPSYSPPPQYNAPPPTYAPPPSNSGSGSSGYSQGSNGQTWGGGGRYAANFEIARPGWSIAALLGFGFDSIYGFGLGARAGYTLPQHIYIGGEFGYFFGGSTTIGSYSTFNLGPEIGYDIGLASAPILIRPYVGLGYDEIGFSCGLRNCPDIGGVGGFALWGGALGTWNFTQNWSAGVDLRIIIPTFGVGSYTYAPGGDVAFTLSALGMYKF